MIVSEKNTLAYYSSTKKKSNPGVNVFFPEQNNLERLSLAIFSRPVGWSLP
jgi:hypothetical protein